jgi:hypothetical protein
MFAGEGNGLDKHRLLSRMSCATPLVKRRCAGKFSNGKWQEKMALLQGETGAARQRA